MDFDERALQAVEQIKKASRTLGELQKVCDLTVAGEYEKALNKLVSCIETDSDFQPEDKQAEGIRKLVVEYDKSGPVLESLCNQLEKNIIAKDISNSAIQKWLFLCKILDQNKRVSEVHRKVETKFKENDDWECQSIISKIERYGNEQLAESDDSEILKVSFVKQARMLFVNIAHLESEMYFPDETVCDDVKGTHRNSQQELVKEESLRCFKQSLILKMPDKAEIIAEKTLSVLPEKEFYLKLVQIAKEFKADDLLLKLKEIATRKLSENDLKEI